jgi:hypothetical protein
MVGNKRTVAERPKHDFQVREIRSSYWDHKGGMQ